MDELHGATRSISLSDELGKARSHPGLVGCCGRIDILLPQSTSSHLSAKPCFVLRINLCTTIPVAHNEKKVPCGHLLWALSIELEQDLADEQHVAQSRSRGDQTSGRGVEEEVIEVALVIVSQGCT